MARSVFFSFHYQRDILRVNQIRNMPNVVGCAAAGFQDASLWEEAKKKSDEAVKRLIDKGLEGTSVTVVCIGAKTAGRKFINYEIERSIARGNGLVGIQIHHLKDQDQNTDLAGLTPAGLSSYKVHKYSDKENLAKWIEQAAKDAGK
jgi:hypothetical protein